MVLDDLETDAFSCTELEDIVDEGVSSIDNMDFLKKLILSKNYKCMRIARI